MPARTLGRPRLEIAADGFVLPAVAAVVAGGLVAAVTDPLDLAHGSWSAAYLVLVCGVVTAMIGVAQQHVDGSGRSSPSVRLELACLWAGNAAVIAGTLLAATPLVDLGGVVLAVGLAIAFVIVRHAGRSPLVVAYRGVLCFVVLSIPVGIALSHLRA